MLLAAGLEACLLLTAEILVRSAVEMWLFFMFEAMLAADNRLHNRTCYINLIMLNNAHLEINSTLNNELFSTEMGRYHPQFHLRPNAPNELLHGVLDPR
ncbi:predicted protein [Sclerotinia sclerotiorum 1980 UF-70]|uniref:Secreted protein n=1 Tax=Sclerotinia sclerotiorum (strain ATCC 18683 / 1980 / Ss-1) TaxID=665079 RepID=A7E709_SCLS1|nr:predicted protein [Sclerotinia sclerotiorum 1980 UF-70]EDN96161.1 predicted protein [Sclerotinia sclerotiorum 1980 UF-70]